MKFLLQFIDSQTLNVVYGSCAKRKRNGYTGGEE